MMLRVAVATENHNAIERNDGLLVRIVIAVMADKIIGGATLHALVTIPLQCALAQRRRSPAIAASVHVAHVLAELIGRHDLFATRTPLVDHSRAGFRLAQRRHSAASSSESMSTAT